MTATVSSATTEKTDHAGGLSRSRHAARVVALAFIMLAAVPAGARAETMLSNFLNALVPGAIVARSEPAAQPEAETKPEPRKPDVRPLAVRPRAPTKVAVAHPVRPSVAPKAPTADPITTGATAQATPSSTAQPETPAQPQPKAQAVPPAPAASSAAAAPAKPASKPRAEAAAKTAPQPKLAPAAAGADADSEAAQFCRNITDAASDARFGWQVRVLEQLDQQVKESVTRLEAKRAEYEDWLKRREDFLRKVEDGVVEMYSRMRPDAAAPQIASMTEEVALSVLMKLKPRASSAILSEMEPTRAARLTDSLAGVRLTTREQGKPQ